MIDSLTMPTTKGANPILFPVPGKDSPGTVTVLCGPNGGGKSFILRTLVNLLNDNDAARTPRSQGWSLKRTEAAASNYRPRHHTTEMRSAGIFSYSRAGQSIKPDRTEKHAQMLIFGMLLRSLPQFKLFDFNRWMSSPSYRQSQIVAIGPVDEERPYWFLQDATEFVRIFNQSFQARLGVRRTKDGLELMMAWGSGSSAPYPNWSDGQKSFFTILAVTELIKPSIYIFDEVENFLHPELISQLIEHVKKNCRQTILSSHHPHLIFGNSIDAVYYVEHDGAIGDAPNRTLKYQLQPAIRRRITLLDDQRSKLASTYRLFDMRDAALLATGALVRDSLDLELGVAMHSHFGCKAVGPSSSPYVDRQSEEIARQIGSFAPSPRIVLDWGAGVGRSLLELSKRVSPAPEASFAWVLYDSDPKVALQLGKLPAPPGATLEIVQDRTGLAEIKAGVVLLTNVLHVLDPEGWCDAIQDGWSAISHPENGILLITEIYPLLAAERDAVPVPSDWLAEFFRDLGFRSNLRAFTLHGATSYCLAVSAPPTSLPLRNELLDFVTDRWKRLSSRYLGEYEGVGRNLTVADHQQLLNATFGMARIASCLRALETNRVRVASVSALMSKEPDI